MLLILLTNLGVCFNRDVKINKIYRLGMIFDAHVTCDKEKIANFRILLGILNLKNKDRKTLFLL